jgi:hypothetical protein
LTEEDRDNLNYILSYQDADEMIEWWMSLSQEDRIYALSLMEVNRLEVLDNYIEESNIELFDVSSYLKKFTLKG